MVVSECAETTGAAALKGSPRSSSRNAEPRAALPPPSPCSRPLVSTTGTVSLSRSVLWAQLRGALSPAPLSNRALKRNGAHAARGSAPRPHLDASAPWGLAHAGLCFVSPSVCVQGLEIAELARYRCESLPAPPAEGAGLTRPGGPQELGPGPLLRPRALSPAPMPTGAPGARVHTATQPFPRSVKGESRAS